MPKMNAISSILGSCLIKYGKHRVIPTYSDRHDKERCGLRPACNKEIIAAMVMTCDMSFGDNDKAYGQSCKVSARVPCPVDEIPLSCHALTNPSHY